MGAGKKENMRCYKRLLKYRNLTKRIDVIELSIEELKEIMCSVSSSRFDGMPRNSGDGSSRTERLYIKLESQQERLAELKGQEQDLYWPLVDILEKLSPKHEAVLTMRYLYGLPFWKIRDAIYGKEMDDELVEDEELLINRYTKRVFKDHIMALQKLEAIWPENWEIDELEEAPEDEE